MGSIWFTYPVHCIYVKSSARDKGEAGGTHQSLFPELESTANRISARQWGMRGVIVRGSHRLARRNFVQMDETASRVLMPLVEYAPNGKERHRMVAGECFQNESEHLTLNQNLPQITIANIKCPKD